MRRPTTSWGWARRPDRADRGGPAMLDLSIRGSIYMLFALEVILVAQMSAVGAWPLTAGILVGILHALVCLATMRAGLGAMLGGPPLRARSYVGLAAATVAAVAALELVHGPADPGFPRVAVLAGLFAGFALFSLVGVLRARQLLLAVVGTWLVIIALALLAGEREDVPFVAGVLGLWLLFLVVVAGRMSAWMLSLVWELDAARQAQAQLAVAEERLRFSRDLHDVVGRTLSAVAVKSELAAELARRGRPDAVEQMLEVRQLAQDSLREVRALAHGYRTADLESEVAGARALLRSAGIDARASVAPDPLDVPVREALAWVVREGTTNVVRHSDATWCTLTLTVGAPGEDAVLTLVNDGVGHGHTGHDDSGGDPVGTAPGRLLSGGSGLVGLRERLTAVGGTLSATRDGDEFTLTARVPRDAGPDRGHSTDAARTATLARPTEETR